MYKYHSTDDNIHWEDAVTWWGYDEVMMIMEPSDDKNHDSTVEFIEWGTGQ